MSRKGLDREDVEARERIGRNIRRVRELRGMTQPALSLAVWGTERAATVSDYESGKRMPTSPTLGRIAVALNVSADVLLGLPIRAETPALAYQAGALEVVAELERQARELRARYGVTPDGAGRAADAWRVRQTLLDRAEADPEDAESDPQSGRG
jgi:transcriptional regulator with XRE-family HTH domain